MLLNQGMKLAMDILIICRHYHIPLRKGKKVYIGHGTNIVGIIYNSAIVYVSVLWYKLYNNKRRTKC